MPILRIPNQSIRWLFTELLVVFVGIFMALQVDSWNQDRLVQEEIELQLSRVEEDARLMKSESARAIDAQDDRLIRFQKALSIIDGEALSEIDREVVESLLANSFQTIDPNLTLSSLDQLINTGDVGLISDYQVRSTLLDFANSERGMDTRFRRIVEIININLPDYFGSVSFDVDEVNPTLRGGASFRLRYNLEEIRANEPFRVALSNIFRMHSYMRQEMQSRQDRLDELISTLENR